MARIYTTENPPPDLDEDSRRATARGLWLGAYKGSGFRVQGLGSRA